MFVRTPESRFTLANFMRSHLYASFGALKVGMDLLLQEEKVEIDAIYGHGGIFKTKGVGSELSGSSTGYTGFCYGDGRRRRSLGHGTSGSLSGQ